MVVEEPHTNRHAVLQRLGKRRLIVIAAAALLIVALVAGGTAYALFGRASATVTITPTSRLMSDVYTISAVTGIPDASRQQVAARLVSATTPAQTKTIQASGHLSVQASQAKGTLILLNWDTAPKTFAAGTDLPDWSADLVVNCGDAPSDIILDATVTVPSAVGSATGYGVAYAPAHILQPGSRGNISGATQNTGNNTHCLYFLWAQGKKCNPGYFTHCWIIEPAGPFSGGQDAYDGPAVQQSDIDGAANSLISANQPNPQQVLQRQIHPNEQYLDAPHCASRVSANHQAGDQAAQVTVSVFFACTGQVYDQKAALTLITRLLNTQAATNLGTGYDLVGQVKTILLNAVPGDQGTIALTISAEGVWAYQFTTAQQQQLAKLLSGKSEQEAMGLAFGQPGVAGVTVHLAPNQQTLPTDPQQISIVVQAVPPAA